MGKCVWRHTDVGLQSSLISLDLHYVLCINDDGLPVLDVSAFWKLSDSACFK